MSTDTRGRRLEIAGWGHQMRVEAQVLRPELQRTLLAALRSGAGIARGLGRSYGDAAVARDMVWQMTRLRRLLSFRPDGLLTAEAGVSLGEILRVFLPQGFTLPVTPGTQWVTLGGAIAADVHGKNHHLAGSIGRYIEEIALYIANGQVRRLRPDRDPELFWATVGGMGLTGVIVEASLRLLPVETGYLQVDYARSGSLEETLNWFLVHDAHYPYTVAWIDGLRSGPSLGRAVLMGARVAARDELPRGADPYPMPRPPVRVPVDLPSGLLSRGVGVAFNALYYGAHRLATQKLEPWWRFFYPLDVVDEWYRLYGRRGFVQYQAIYPPDVGARELSQLLTRIHTARHANFLGVLKRMGESSPGLLSFPTRGLTLALDLPMHGYRTRDLFQALYDETADLGGRVYLAKDSFLSPSLFRSMYPRHGEFLERKAEVDPQGRWCSLLSERLALEVTR